MLICNIVMNFCDSFRPVTRCIGKAHPVLENPEFIIALETSKALEAESDALYIF